MVVVTPKPASGVSQRRYLRAPVPVHFPQSESVPETGRHMRLRTALWSMLRFVLGNQAIVASEQFLYWDPTDPKQCLAPDVLVWLGAPDHDVPTWKVWERGAPHLAVEIVSDSDARDRAWTRKFKGYQRSGVLELVRFDPEELEHPLRLWDRIEGDLVEREVSKHELERSDVLGLYWLVDSSPDLGLMLRLSHDSAGGQLLLADDEGRRAEAEARAIAEARIRVEAEARAIAEARIRELEAELARARGE